MTSCTEQIAHKPAPAMQYIRRDLHSDLHSRDFLGMAVVWFSSVLHCFDLKCAKWYAMRAPYVRTRMQAYRSCIMYVGVSGCWTDL